MFLKKVFIAIFIVGILLLLQVLIPIFAFEIWSRTGDFQSQILYDPVPQQKEVNGIFVADYYSGGFVREDSIFTKSFYSEFYLTIPNISLKNITVKVNSQEFDYNLAHFPGTALPGEIGNVFISGHSGVDFLPFPYSKKAFFSKLMYLKKDDAVQLKADDQTYIYKVVGIKVVDPNDLSVLNPPDSKGKYLSLMTCVPPGINTKRLVVLTKIY